MGCTMSWGDVIAVLVHGCLVAWTTGHSSAGALGMNAEVIGTSEGHRGPILLHMMAGHPGT